MERRIKYVCFGASVLTLLLVVGANFVDASVFRIRAGIPKGCSALLFSDDFDVDGVPDSTRWFFERGYVRNGEIQYYTESNCRCKDGVLVIEASVDSVLVDGAMCPVTSSSISSRLPARWRYGYAEVRARLPEGEGYNPAVVLMPAECTYGHWPRSGEIRLMERNASTPGLVYFCYHSERFNHLMGTERTHAVSLPDTGDGFHTYAISWTRDRLIWYFDGREVYSAERQKDSDWTSWPFDQDFYLNINLSVGGWRSDGTRPEPKPQRFEIDYVKIYS